MRGQVCCDNMTVGMAEGGRGSRIMSLGYALNRGAVLSLHTHLLLSCNSNQGHRNETTQKLCHPFLLLKLVLLCGQLLNSEFSSLVTEGLTGLSIANMCRQALPSTFFPC